MRLSKGKVNPHLKKELYQALHQTLADLKNPQDIKDFLEAFLSEAEHETLTKRVAVAYWLDKGRSYVNICDNLKVSSARQYHKKYQGRVVSKQYGYYRPASKYIYISNRTAVRGQILAAKTFIETLLHEWVHHYDFCSLKFNSIHTSGFYARLNDLKEKLKRGLLK